LLVPGVTNVDEHTSWRKTTAEILNNLFYQFILSTRCKS
jgi:hypothetical protein